MFEVAVLLQEFVIVWPPEWVCGLIYVCIYVFLRQPHCVTLWFYVFREKRIVHDYLPFYSFCFSFHSEVTCSLHVFYLCYRGKRHQLRKPLLYYFDIYVNRNKCILKTLFIVSLLMHRIITTSCRPLITLCCSPFIWMFIYLKRFHSVPIFQRVHSVGEL